MLGCGRSRSARNVRRFRKAEDRRHAEECGALVLSIRNTFARCEQNVRVEIVSVLGQLINLTDLRVTQKANHLIQTQAGSRKRWAPQSSGGRTPQAGRSAFAFSKPRSFLSALSLWRWFCLGRFAFDSDKSTTLRLVFLGFFVGLFPCCKRPNAKYRIGAVRIVWTCPQE
jgi:hypothetical protein